ncbi:hypothetical protein D3C78_1477890 [compost metagenome]
MDAPIPCAASITPRSTSLSAVSTNRAKNGAAPITSGGIVPRTPIEVPTISLVIGIKATIKIINGTERRIFTSNDKTE